MLFYSPGPFWVCMRFRIHRYIAAPFFSSDTVIQLQPGSRQESNSSQLFCSMLLVLWSTCCQSGPWQESPSSGICSVYLILVIYLLQVWQESLSSGGCSVVLLIHMLPVWIMAESHSPHVGGSVILLIHMLPVWIMAESHSPHVGGSVILLIHMLPVWILAGVTLLR